MMKKDHFKEKLSLWPQVPFKDNDLIYELVLRNNVHQLSETVTLSLALN